MRRWPASSRDSRSRKLTACCSTPWPAIQAKEMTIRAMHPGRIITPPGQGKEMAGATRYHVRKGLCAMGLSAEPAGVERAEMYTWTQGE